MGRAINARIHKIREGRRGISHKMGAAQSLNVEEVDDPQSFFLVRQLAF
jgi:hypothetical protein